MHIHVVVKLNSYTFLYALESKVATKRSTELTCMIDSRSIVMYTMCKQYHDVDIINDFAMHTGMCKSKVSPHHECA